MTPDGPGDTLLTGGGQATKLSWTAAIAATCILPLGAATVTLSQAGILALDLKEWAHSASILSAAPSGDGVEYTIAFATNWEANLQLVSSVSGGKGTFVGLPWKPGDSFALRFTLLSPVPVPAAHVSAGAAINTRDTEGYRPVDFGGSLPPSGVSSTSSDAKLIRTVGFAVGIGPENAWPAEGGTIRLLVEPARYAAIIEPPSDSTYRQRFDAATLTLSQSSMLAIGQPVLGSGLLPATSILGRVANGTGVEYTIRFSKNGDPALLELPASVNPAFGELPPSIGHFALRFTLLSSTASPGAALAALVRVDDGRPRTWQVRFGYDGSSVPAEVNVDFEPRSAKFVWIAIRPDIKPDVLLLAGQTVRVLVEPSPNAVVADVARWAKPPE